MNTFIRSLTEEDFDEANTILMLAYDTKKNLKRELQRFFSLQSDGWFMVMHNGKPVGLGGTVNYGTHAYIGLIAMHPDVQRRGLGGKLMGHLLNWLESRHCPLILLEATEAGAPLYERLGFVDEGLTLIFRQHDSVCLPAPARQVFPLQCADMPALVAFDTPIFGAKRESVLAAYLNDFADRAFVTHNETGEITGYIFAQHASIGPWIAQKPADAEALLTKVLSLPFKSAPDVLFPAVNSEAVQLLTAYGFRQRHAYRHMRRGGLSSPIFLPVFYGQASPAIG